jgi:hypothetical protein
LHDDTLAKLVGGNHKRYEGDERASKSLRLRCLRRGAERVRICGCSASEPQEAATEGACPGRPPRERDRTLRRSRSSRPLRRSFPVRAQGSLSRAGTSAKMVRHGEGELEGKLSYVGTLVCVAVTIARARCAPSARTQGQRMARTLAIPACQTHCRFVLLHHS